ncbi:undecaprenyl-diphosphate phosphatase [Bacillus mangrovi]|uniref:Undecaprenyl-diphosphatase n=1 Tax=Metabacillus mangrovi TaxID=1491830 RepID=A0A7X2S2Y8_9BACI|nr:undecaprenyl-diphosphate phosphatase [Metabacillus mangrovi]MTH52223.1 undecaprenyl-diphosphate phosphatase [Metabacillus mangrovi]
MNDILIGIIMGLIEGLAEFLPISSTGHLILTAEIIGFSEDPREPVFEVFIQFGAILAIAVLYWRRLLSMFNLKPLIKKEKKFNALHVVLGILPAVAVGAIFYGTIKSMFHWSYVVAGLIAGAVLMIAAEKLKKKPKATTLDELTYKQALTIGVFQCLAVWPGFSRAGSTISGGLLARADYKTASEFSFLIAVPLMAGAASLDLIKNLNVLQAADIPLFAAGFVTAFVVAMAAVLTFLNILKKAGLIPFAIYRIVLAGVFWVYIIQ